MDCMENVCGEDCISSSSVGVLYNGAQSWMGFNTSKSLKSFMTSKLCVCIFEVIWYFITSMSCLHFLDNQIHIVFHDFKVVPSSSRTRIMQNIAKLMQNMNIFKLMYSVLINLSLHDMKFWNNYRYKIYISYTLKNLPTFNDQALEQVTMFNLPRWRKML